MSNETAIEEVPETEIETGPEAGGLVPLQSKEQVQDLIFFAENLSAIIEAQNKIRMAILKLTQPADWTLFNNKAEIGFAPANRIGSTLGVSYLNWSAEKVIGSDEKGSWYRWEYQADAVHGKRVIRVYGRAGSRDKFFGKKDGVYRELHDVDEGNIKMAAMRACKKEGVKDLFGLHHMDPGYLKKYGVDLTAAGGHTFKDQKEQAEEAQSVSVVIAAVNTKTGKNESSGKVWVKYQIKDIEGVVYQTFSESMGTEANKAKESKEPAALTFKVDPKYGPELLSINGVTGSTK